MLVVTAVVGGVLLAGCSDGGGGTTGATCASNASCGGDIVGTWAIAQACGVRTSKAVTCSEEQYSVTDAAQTGTFVFRADGTAMQAVTTTGTMSLTLPPSCLAQSAQTCAEVEADYRANVQSGYTAASCVDNAGTCECTLMFATSTNVSGTYTTSGSTLMASGNLTASYCVTGSTLVLKPDVMPTGDPPSVYVLTRQ
jgi:hypothetical protein